MTPAIPFDNTYVHLPERFYARLEPSPVRQPQLIRLNVPLARALRIYPDALDAEILSGNRVPDGAAPAALAYAGHQFGHFVPQLGDGRAVLLGEVVGQDGQRRDIQLKGSGPTPFSRRGDGRAALGPVLREYLVSEAMAALGIATTRSLAVVTTGERVMRETVLPGAVLTRIASSHIRVGTFQYFAARGDVEGVRTLADYAIRRHYPALAETPDRYAAFLAEVALRQAELVAHWLLVGFIHGVMNTDNCSVAGETIDYGPCAFMDAYDPGAVYSSIDHAGRYAYANQPQIAQWNVARLAETLLPLLHEEDEAAIEVARTALSGFAPRFEAAYQDGLRRKIGLATAQPDDALLVRDLLKLMTEDAADFTLVFRALCNAAESEDGDAALHAQFKQTDALQAWQRRWQERLIAEAATPAIRAASMRAVNPAFIPRNHLVEAALHAAITAADYTPFDRLMNVLSRPYQDDPANAEMMQPPQEHERVLQTFCGT